MLNTSNICIFEGRMTKDVQIQTVGQGQNQYSKALFSIACDRTLTKDQKQAKASGQQVVSSDFPQFVATGAVADIIAQYFPKGKPIKIFASFQSYQKKDANGNTTYGQIFKVENIGFALTDSSNGNGGNNNGNNNGGGNYNNNNNGGNNYNNNNNGGNNYNNNKGGKQNNAQGGGDFFPVDDMEIPF